MTTDTLRARVEQAQSTAPPELAALLADLWEDASRLSPAWRVLDEGRKHAADLARQVEAGRALWMAEALHTQEAHKILNAAGVPSRARAEDDSSLASSPLLLRLQELIQDRDEALAEVERLRRTLSAVLTRFTEPGHIGAAGDCLRTGWVQAGLVNEWREVAAPRAEKVAICGHVVRTRELAPGVRAVTRCPLPPGHDGDPAEALGGNPTGETP